MRSQAQQDMDSMVKESLQNALVEELSFGYVPGSDMPPIVSREDIMGEQACKDIASADSIDDALNLCGKVIEEWGDPYESAYGWGLVRAMAWAIDNMSVWTKEECDE